MNKRVWYDNFWLGWIGAISVESFFELLPGQSRDTSWPMALLVAAALAYVIWRSHRNRVVEPHPHTCKRGALTPEEGCTQTYMHPLWKEEETT